MLFTLRLQRYSHSQIITADVNTFDFSGDKRQVPSSFENSETDHCQTIALTEYYLLRYTAYSMSARNSLTRT